MTLSGFSKPSVQSNTAADSTMVTSSAGPAIPQNAFDCRRWHRRLRRRTASCERRVGRPDHRAEPHQSSAAKRIRKIVTAERLDLGIRIVLHMGPVVIGDFGGKDRIAYTLGETVNSASRYEQARKDRYGVPLGTVHLSDTILSSVAPRIQCPGSTPIPANARPSRAACSLRIRQSTSSHHGNQEV